MFGCSSMASTRASSTKRALSSSCTASSGGRILIATSCPVTRWRAAIDDAHAARAEHRRQLEVEDAACR